ncbi:MAG: polyprenyl synthetase family protein [Alistipes sp.]|jgi:geranylgeranyl diphosphate synthase type II|nr:polyprenyl synthetase family protein [Alistipes sp.]MBQ6572364.1 polyprenyl synthetase family protein [Alistipes sp.]MBR0332912.1 polyprenyl synthetase family protein [Alistipes sp.]
MRNNEEILLLLENYLAQIELPKEPQYLYDPIIYSMSGGGKRIRPTLLMLSCEAFGGNAQDALPAAAAVEMFHNFTLLHDDIMDNASVRRGKPSVAAEWGNNVAILSGDAMMIYSYRLLSQVPAHLLPRVMEIFTTIALQVCEGQQYDMDFETRQKVSVVEYMNMIELKTSVLLAGAASIGAVLGGASDADSRKIYRYALELGLAFQLQDDLLDSYGREEELGKKIGGDILEGKKTCLMLNAMSRSTEADREILRSTHLDESLSPEQKIARVKEVYDRYDIPRLINQQISLRFERALSILDTLEIPAERTEHLRVFAQNLMDRKK